MPEVAKHIIRSSNSARPLESPSRSARAHPPHDARCLLFFVADLVFLVLAGIAANMTMHLVHQLEWPFIPTSLFGMMAAMLVQTLMAFAVAPLLGSIESMVPSMIVAMLSPMTICLLHLFGCESSWTIAVGIGVAFALGTFTWIQLYARSSRHALTRRTVHSGG